MRQRVYTTCRSENEQSAVKSITRGSSIPISGDALALRLIISHGQLFEFVPLPRVDSRLIFYVESTESPSGSLNRDHGPNVVQENLWTLSSTFVRATAAT